MTLHGKVLVGTIVALAILFVVAVCGLTFNVALVEGGGWSVFAAILMVLFVGATTAVGGGTGFLTSVGSLTLVCGLSMYYGPLHLAGIFA